jgi:hypothetical protein
MGAAVRALVAAIALGVSSSACGDLAGDVLVRRGASSDAGLSSAAPRDAGSGGAGNTGMGERGPDSGLQSPPFGFGGAPNGACRTAGCRSGTGWIPQCNADSQCAGGFCDIATGTCIECRTSSDCSGTSPFCYAVWHVCVECLTDADCGDPTKECGTLQHCVTPCSRDGTCGGGLVCDPTTRYCVACRTSADCHDPLAPDCSRWGACVRCLRSPC